MVRSKAAIAAVPAGLEGGVRGHLASGGSGDEEARGAVLAGDEGRDSVVVDGAGAVM